MDKRERLKQKKKKRRRHRISKSREQQRRHERNVELYPQFVFDQQDIGHVPPEFVKGVVEASRRIHFNNRQQLTPEGAAVYRLMKHIGFIPAYQAVCDGADERDRFVFQHRLQIGLGQLLFLHMHELGLLDRYLPYCAVRLVFVQDIHVRVDALLRAKSSSDTNL